MGKVLAITNRKGGCEKSFTTASLGVELARQGKKVLYIDADNQHSLTVSLGIAEPDNLPVTLTTVIADIIAKKNINPIEGIIHHAEDIDLLPANDGLTGMELTLAAADSAIIPVTPKSLDVKGLELLLKSILEMREFINPNLEICGILLTIVDKRTNFTKEAISMIENAYGEEICIFNDHIPHSVRAAETSATGKSIFSHDPNGTVIYIIGGYVLKKRFTSFFPVALRFIVVHVVTYAVCGISFMLISGYFDYFAANPLRSMVMKPADALTVRLAVSAQFIRDFLLAFAIYSFRSIILEKPLGWSKLFTLMLILSSIGAVVPGSGSIEGFLYTNLSFKNPLIGMPEIIVQMLAFSLLFCNWQRNKQKS